MLLVDNNGLLPCAFLWDPTSLELLELPISYMQVSIPDGLLCISSVYLKIVTTKDETVASRILSMVVQPCEYKQLLCCVLASNKLNPSLQLAFPNLISFTFISSVANSENTSEKKCYTTSASGHQWEWWNQMKYCSNVCWVCFPIYTACIFAFMDVEHIFLSACAFSLACALSLGATVFIHRRQQSLKWKKRKGIILH